MDNRVISIATGKPIALDAAPKRRLAKQAPAVPVRHRPELRPPDESEPLGTLQLRAGLSDQQAIALCGVSANTWRNWRSGRVRVPLAVRRLLNLYAGEVPSVDKAWRGFVFRGDRLFATNGESVTPAELENLHVFRQAEAHMMDRMRELEFWASVSGRAEQVRMARAFGALDAAACMLVALHKVIDECPSNAVKRGAGELLPLIHKLFDVEKAMSRAAGIMEHR